MRWMLPIALITGVAAGPAPINLSFALPEPPVPPLAPPSSELAPMPNHNLSAPLHTTKPGAQVSPDMFRPRTEFRGDGFAPGSTQQSVEMRNLRPTYGLKLSMPLE